MITKKRGLFLPSDNDIKNIISQLDTLLIQNNKNITEDYGSHFGKQILHRLKKSQYKTPSTFLLNLPIYFIICHSSLDVNMNLKKNKLHLRKGPHSEHSLCHFKNNIINNKIKFILYPTPSSTWGLLSSIYSVDNEFYEPDYIYNLKKNTIIKCLFKKNSSKRIYNKPNVNDDYGRAEEDFTIEQAIGGYFLPGLFMPQKDQQFNGNSLIEGGFGIVKVNGNNSFTSRMTDNEGKVITLKKRIQEAMNKKTHLRLSKRWKDNGWDKDRVSDSKFFVIDEGWNTASREDIELRKLLKNQDNLFMEQITETGEEGIYITLSCSNLNMAVVDEKSGSHNNIYVTPEILDNHDMFNWVKLRKQLINKYDDIFLYHKRQWDLMTDVINWNIPENISCYIDAQYLDDTKGIDKDEYMQGRDVILKQKFGPITRKQFRESNTIGNNMIK